MKRGTGLILAMTVAFVAACASAGGGGAGQPQSGNPPRDNSFTNAAGVHLAQAQLVQGQEATAHYQSAYSDAMEAIEADSMNPKGYLMAAQAAVGLGNWEQADDLFEKAQELYPQYATEISGHREQGWVDAYNQGAEAMNQGDGQTAIAMFEGADLLYQERPEARLALGSLYLREGDTESAIDAYLGALEILEGEPPEGLDEEQLQGWTRDREIAAFNASQLLSQTGEYEEAAEVLRGFMADSAHAMDESTTLRARTALAGYMAQAGQADSAQAMYDDILTREGLTSAEYFQIGIGFFNTGDYDRAAEAFEEAARLNPFSRDALLNLVQSLYSQAMELEELEPAAERDAELNSLYDQILDAAEQVRAFDPLNRNLLSFMLRSLRGKIDLSGDADAEELTRRTQELFRAYQQQPYEVSDISLALTGGGQADLTGVLTNLTGNPGDEVQLRFSVVNRQGDVLDSSMVTVTAPEQNAAVQFSTSIDVSDTDFAGWMYEVVN